ncbi:TKL protein kinase [Phytophthora palmivora]|uniref:TKL protein kinase n=1 Tax=Phytophthora palmivora TaxID=4796 RepID=A0A2P4XZT9_9STRA|nr:TKL protein kinase [Phytophthora palmivora]
MESRRRSVAGLLLLQALGASAIERFVLSQTGNASLLSSGETLVPLELSSAALTHLLTTSQDLSPVTFDSYVAAAEWKLSNWSVPLSKMLQEGSDNNQTVLVDVQLQNALDVTVSQLLIKKDDTPLDADLTLTFGKDALAGLTELVQVHVDGMKTTFEDAWLPTGVDLHQLIFDDSTVENLELETMSMVQQVVIRKSNLSFPTAVLGLDTAVTTLILEYNTISGPIELTENEYTQLANITDFRATGNTVDKSGSGSSCVKEENIGKLAICIVNDVQSTATSLNTGIVILSFFRRFKRKASKFVDERLTFSNREDGLLTGRGSEGESEQGLTGDAKILADMDLGKDQVTLHKKLGIQGLWLGEYQDTKVVALKFVPRELNMSLDNLNAVRLSYAPLRHDNIVTFLGSSWTDREEVLIVVEHMSKGSLRAVLADEKIELTWPQQLQMSKDICHGLNFVRSVRDINLSRNLTSRSVLLDAELTCKLDIFDYASSLRTDLVPVRSFGRGDISSRAPELLKGEEITTAAEVYALGVIFCEISSRSKLFEQELEERGHTMGDIFIATEVVAQRLKPSPAENAPADFRKLTLRCLSYEPSERPTISEIASMISK